MKKALFILITFSLFCISCKQKAYTLEEDGGIVIKCRITETDGESINSIETILSQRLNKIDPAIIPVIKHDNGDNKYDIEIPGITDQSISLLLSHGTMNIMEIYYKDEAISTVISGEIMDSIRMIYTPNSSFSYFTQYILLPQIEKSKTSIIDSIIKANYSRLRFPKDLSLAWKSEDNKKDLYMLRETKNNVNINKTFVSSKVERSKYNDNSYEIRITLDAEGAKQFALLTEKNIGRPLAFMLDDKVLMAPNVNDRIEEGRMSITGGLNEKELILINSMLHSPIIKSNIEVLKVTTIDKPQK